MLYLSRNARHKLRVNAVLPDPTGPPIPIRKGLRSVIIISYCYNWVKFFWENILDFFHWAFLILIEEENKESPNNDEKPI